MGMPIASGWLPVARLANVLFFLVQFSNLWSSSLPAPSLSIVGWTSLQLRKDQDNWITIWLWSKCNKAVTKNTEVNKKLHLHRHCKTGGLWGQTLLSLTLEFGYPIFKWLANSLTLSWFHWLTQTSIHAPCMLLSCWMCPFKMSLHCSQGQGTHDVCIVEMDTTCHAFIMMLGLTTWKLLSWRQHVLAQAWTMQWLTASVKKLVVLFLLVTESPTWACCLLTNCLRILAWLIINPNHQVQLAGHCLSPALIVSVCVSQKCGLGNSKVKVSSCRAPNSQFCCSCLASSVQHCSCW